MTLILLVCITLMLSAANGANDNIKGAATLVGSGLTDYRHAIAWATAATALGGLVSLVLANGLLLAFGGRGIVPDAIAASPVFLPAVGLGAGSTVWLATRFALPVSTTHALLGGLLGAGLAAAPQDVNFMHAMRTMMGPLLISPVVAIALALMAVPLLRRLRAAPEPCVCVAPAASAVDDAGVVAREMLIIGSRGSVECETPATVVASVSPPRALDRMHYFSAMSVSFARGLNDTPKIAGLLVASGSIGAGLSTAAVVIAMALGGLFAARRVADTLAWRITRMDAAEGLGANLVTAALVVVASRFGLPVSTTHVSTGALFGIAAGNRGGRTPVILGIVGAWMLTLPLAALLSAIACATLSAVI